MSLAEEHLLLDAANLTIILLGMSLVAALLWRHHRPLPVIAHYGKVSLGAFRLPELGIAVFLVFFFYLVVRYPTVLRPASQSIFLALLLGAWLVSRHQDLVEVFGLTSLNGRRLTLWSIAALIFITVCTMGTMQLWKNWLSHLIGEPDLQDKVRMLQENSSLTFRIGLFVSAVILAPLTEEVVFRGFLYPALKRYTQPLVAAVIISGTFAAIHFSAGALIPLFVLSLLLVLAYELSGNLLVPILVHAGFNLINIVYAISAAPAAPAYAG